MSQPPTDREAKPTFTCAQCGRTETGMYLAGGWWRYPAGWLVHDDLDRVVCSDQCAAVVGGRPPRTPAR